MTIHEASATRAGQGEGGHEAAQRGQGGRVRHTELALHDEFEALLRRELLLLLLRSGRGLLRLLLGELGLVSLRLGRCGLGA